MNSELILSEAAKAQSKAKGNNGRQVVYLDQATSDSESVVKVAILVWDPDALAWVKATGSGGGGSGGSSGGVAISTLTTNVDEASSTVTYVGKAAPGSATSAAVWQIFKLTVSGTQTLMTYADGDSLHNNIWDNRAALTYS